MKIIFQKETRKSGVVVIESAPQTRTILLATHIGYKTLNFPYLLYTLCYRKIYNRYKYAGIYGYGLRIFMRNKPLKSLLDRVYYPLTDLERFGLVCTPHHLDKKVYDTIDEMAIEVIDSWWNARHVVPSLIEWQRHTPETLLKAKFLNTKIGGFRFKDGVCKPSYELSIMPKILLNLPDRPKFISKNIGDSSLLIKIDFV